MAKAKFLSFTQALQELNRIAERLDSDTLDIDEGLKAFERGLWLVQHLQQRLRASENKVKELKIKFQGAIAEDAGVT